jgi:GTP 3',8-cyclase
MVSDTQNIQQSPADSALQDQFGRKIINLRISVTDRCNFRCTYCMPAEGMQWIARREILTFEEIERLVRIFASLGVDRVRLTGGEPMMRQNLDQLIAMLKQVPGIDNIALTTNGYFLEEGAKALIDAGLDRINISLDSLEREKFSRLVRKDMLDKVLRGIHTVAKLPIQSIKINMVVIRGVNDNEIPAFAQLAREHPFKVRFIEFMPLGADDDWGRDKVVPSSEVCQQIETVAPLVPIDETDLHPAARYRFADGQGEIGVISSVTAPFCDQCNRVRITPEGQFRTCLFSLQETDLKTLVRGDASDEDIATTIRQAVWQKEEGHLINRPDFQRPSRPMSQIGG